MERAVCTEKSFARRTRGKRDARKVTYPAQFRARHARPQPLASRPEGGKRPAPTTMSALGMAPPDIPRLLCRSGRSSPRTEQAGPGHGSSGGSRLLASSPRTPTGSQDAAPPEQLRRRKGRTTTLVLAAGLSPIRPCRPWREERTPQRRWSWRLRQTAPSWQPPGPGRCLAWTLSRSAGAHSASS